MKTNRLTTRLLSLLAAFANPLFPALRSSPTAFSGASRKKQIPSSSIFVKVLSVLGLYTGELSAEVWSIVSSGTNHDITGITWDGNRFIAVDSEGGILQSANATSWTRLQTGSFGFTEIVSGGGRYIALEGDSDYYESSDRVQWTIRSTGQSNWVNGGTYDGAKFVLVGEYGTILKSSDGLSWSAVTSSPTNSDLERVTFGNGLYVAVGLDGIFTSSNSTVWTKRIAATTYGFSDVAYSGGRFIATAFIDSKIFSSLNGILWTEKTIDTLSNTFPNLPPWGNAVCGSANGFKIVCDSGKAFHTVSGSSLTTISTQTTSDFNDVAYGNGTYVAVGDNGLIRTLKTSTPLEIWRMANFGITENSGDASNLQDPDGDGIPNIIEYALGYSPKQTSVLPLPNLNGTTMTMSFRVPDSVDGVSILAEFSESLKSTEWTNVANSGVFPNFIFSLPKGNKTKLFMRIKVTNP
jgi:hypothetical protein